MFKFLKDKLKDVVKKFSKEVEEEPIKTEKVEEIKEEAIKPRLEESEKLVIEKEPVKDVRAEKPLDIKPVKESEKEQGFFKKLTKKITSKRIDEDKFEELFQDLELILLENNVAVEVIDKIKESMKIDLVDVDLHGNIENKIKESLKQSIEEILSFDNIDLIKKVKSKKPFIILFVGINGSGKTTTIAKIVNLFNKNNLKCVIAASDTFRAASIEQLQHHADNLNVKLIKHTYKSDPAAVAFDAIKHAEAHKLDAVLIDTAGRMHSNENLIDEMKKIVRVAKPDLKLFIGESITGNDCIEQANTFNKAINFDGIILAKADIDEKGGTALSISYVTRKPILYLGTGQNYDNLEEFNKEKVVKSLGL